MTTLAKNYGALSIPTPAITLSARYRQFIKKVSFSYYGFIAMAILTGSCLGGITTMQVFEHNAPFWEFILSLGITMANLVACIGQAPVKWAVNLFAACLLVNTVLLLVNVL